MGDRPAIDHQRLGLAAQEGQADLLVAPGRRRRVKPSRAGVRAVAAQRQRGAPRGHADLGVRRPCAARRRRDVHALARSSRRALPAREPCVRASEDPHDSGAARPGRGGRDGQAHRAACRRARVSALAELVARLELHHREAVEDVVGRQRARTSAVTQARSTGPARPATTTSAAGHASAATRTAGRRPGMPGQPRRRRPRMDSRKEAKKIWMPDDHERRGEQRQPLLGQRAEAAVDPDRRRSPPRSRRPRA